jgi:Flp pilus assembly protein TadB
MTAFIAKAFGLGSIVAAILLIVALLKQLVTMFGFLLALVKFGIIMAFVMIIVMIVLAIWSDRKRRRREEQDF